MAITKEVVQTKLAKYIISRKTHPHLPPTLDGELLLEEDRDEDGNLKGVITISIDDFLNLLDCKNPNTSRLAGMAAEERVKKAKELGIQTIAALPALTYNNLRAFDPEDILGYKKYLDKWHHEGLI